MIECLNAVGESFFRPETGDIHLSGTGILCNFYIAAVPETMLLRPLRTEPGLPDRRDPAGALVRDV